MMPGDEAIPVLDLAVVADLRASTGDDDAFLRDLIATFVEEAATHLDAMNAALGADDPSAIVRPAHTLKSSSASVGALRLSETCRRIELAGREGRVDGQEREVALASGVWADTLAALRAAELVG